MSIIPKFYTTSDNVNKYIAMTRNINGIKLIDELKKILPQHSSLLELGSGPGNDFSLLNKDYHVIGSDLSVEFLKHLNTRFPQEQFLKLDAASLKTTLHFDAIYSNKVLHHLSNEELQESISNQICILKPEGIICHSFWKGNGTENFKGMFVNNHTKLSLSTLFSDRFNIIHLSSYEEFEEDDSLLLIARKK